MVWGVEAIQRARPQLVQVEIVRLGGMILGSEHEDSRTRLRADNVLHDPIAFREILDRIELDGFLDGSAGRYLWTVHAPFRDLHARRIRNDGLLEGDFCPVCKGRNHVWFLAPLSGESLLGRRIPIRIVKAFDVPAQDGLDSDPLPESGTIHDD